MPTLARSRRCRAHPLSPLRLVLNPKYTRSTCHHPQTDIDPKDTHEALTSHYYGTVLLPHATRTHTYTHPYPCYHGHHHCHGDLPRPRPHPQRCHHSVRGLPHWHITARPAPPVRKGAPADQVGLSIRVGRARGRHETMDRRKIMERQPRLWQLPHIPRNGGQARRQRCAYFASCKARKRKVARRLCKRRLRGRGTRRLPIQARRSDEAVLQHHHPERTAPPPHQLLLALKLQQPPPAHKRRPVATHPTA